MRKILTSVGAFLGLALASAGTGHAECQQSRFCLDGACQPVVACGNVEASSTPTTASKVPSAAAPALQPVAAHPAPPAHAAARDSRDQMEKAGHRRRR
jgi:hypothetical protein